MFEEIVNYTEVADKKIISIFESAIINMPEAERLFSHVLNAQHVWIERILGNVPLYGIWETHSKTHFKIISANNFESIRRILASRAVDEQIVYQNSVGEQFQNTVSEILFQLLNHSTYHRAQLATLFKKEGIVPPVTDYIIFKRNHLL